MPDTEPSLETAPSQELRYSWYIVEAKPEAGRTSRRGRYHIIVTSQAE